MTAPLLAIDGLMKDYVKNGRTIHVLRGLSVAVEPGEIVSITGHSGSGKSTLLHVAGTLDRPTGGTVAWLGRDVSRLPNRELAAFRNRTIGFVFQFHHLLPDFTALENAAMPALVAGLPRIKALSAARETLELVGLADRLTHKPFELSGGEQQRVAIARALVQQPRMLFADEPTGNLDEESSDDIHRLLIAVNRERGVTMMIVTHKTDFARSLPRRCVLEEGLLRDQS